MLKSEEFAEQIQHLNSKKMSRAMSKSKKSQNEFDEDRNVSHPMYVSQWLVAVASSRCSKVNEACPVISKKMRDEVIKGKGKGDLPFRRSGFYTCMKVFLQLGLTIELGSNHAKFIYKLAMLKFISGVCQDHSVDAHIAIHMLAKIARRMEKIRKCELSVDDNCEGLVDLKKRVLLDAGRIIHIEREKMNESYDAIEANERRKSFLEPMPKLPFEEDIIHIIPNLLEHMKVRNAKAVSDPVDNYPHPRQIIRHAWHNMAFPEVNRLNQISGEIDVSQLLADFEHWILVALDENYRNYTASSLRALATAYMSKARSFYQNDCFGYSKMVLAMLKIIQVCYIQSSSIYKSFQLCFNFIEIIYFCRR